MTADCSRCGSQVAKAKRDSLGRTAALSLAALLLYVPANIYPIMRMEFHGVFTESTVWDGCVRLFQDGQWLVAVIVFLASLLVPLLKLLGLFFLVITTKLSSPRARPLRTRIHQLIEVIGPWAMLDVFLLAILVALVKLGRIATVTPGPGLLAFTSVVGPDNPGFRQLRSPTDLGRRESKLMSKETPHSRGDLPQAKTKKRRWKLSPVWAVPAVAALLAGYLVYQRVLEYGSTITIQFREASGVNPGQTPVKYRGVDIGQVGSIRLSEDQQYATLEVKLKRQASSVAREDSVFWIVRPQLGMGNFTGLGTIITGPYIEVLPGEGEAASEFIGAEQSPKILDPDGLNLILLSPHSASLRAGVPIYYRGIAVGAVREARLTTNANAVAIQGVIRPRYAPLVRTDSKFWNVTGMDVRVGLFSGAEVDVESLKSLFIGGIAFATPDDSNPRPVPDGMVFRLHDQAKPEWREWSPPISIPIESDGAEQAEIRTPRDLPFPQRNPP